MRTSDPVRFNVTLSTNSAARLEGLVNASGLKRATLARLVLEHFLRDPNPAQLFALPPYRGVDPGASAEQSA